MPLGLSEKEGKHPGSGFFFAIRTAKKATGDYYISQQGQGMYQEEFKM